MKTKNKVGRPRMFKSPEQMMNKALEFQKICLKNDRPFLFISFASWMGVHSTTVSEYAKFPEFTETVKNIQQMAEIALIEGGMTGRYNPSMSIFLAKNNHGYTDQQHLEVSGKLDLATMAKDRYDKIKNEK